MQRFVFMFGKSEAEEMRPGVLQEMFFVGGEVAEMSGGDF